MPVKLIAVDMDGTFLNEDKHYNKARFLAQYAALKKRGIYFVAASGNQLQTLKNYFSDIQNEIAYVAENGAFTVNASQEIHFSHFPIDVKNRMIQDLVDYCTSAVVVCGKQGAYVSNQVSQADLNTLDVYFKQLTQVNHLLDIEDDVCKVTIQLEPDSRDQLLAHLSNADYIKDGHVKMVSSGFGFIDLIVPNKHKAYGLAFLQQLWQVQDHEILAIGDNNNDIEMVEKAGYGIAMQNAVPELKEVASYIVKSNEEEGVLDVIDCVLNADSAEHLIYLLAEQE